MAKTNYFTWCAALDRTKGCKLCQDVGGLSQVHMMQQTENMNGLLVLGEACLHLPKSGGNPIVAPG